MWFNDGIIIKWRNMPSIFYLFSMISIMANIRLISADSGVDEIELNVKKIAELGNTDILLSTISRLALALNKCGVDVRGLKELQKVMLPSHSRAKCMDGTNAGYYIRKKTGSKRWLLFLDGGNYCFDKRSCRSRSENTPNLTGSAYWPSTKEGSGILSWNPEENPFLFSANVVYVPYCSSDAWSGNNTKNGLHFMGVSIIDAVIEDLYKHGLKTGGKLFFAGSSAGATGVMLNIDRVSDTLAVQAPGVSVHGIVDSGWFLDTEQLHKTECTNTLNCPPAEAVKKGFRLWKPAIPKRCRRAYPLEPWRCFFGYRIYPYIKTPLFVIAYLYDSAQVFASMGGGVSMYRQVQQETYAKRNSERITFMRELARLMNHTLSNVSAVFAPSCMDHELLLRRNWHSVSIREVTLVEALRCWEGSQETTNRPRQERLAPYPWTSGNAANTGIPDLSALEGIDSGEEETNTIRHTRNKLDREERRRQRRIRKQKKRQRAMRNRHRKVQRVRRSGVSGEDGEDDETLLEELLANAIKSNSLNTYATQRGQQCLHRLYDYCTKPNCNMRCPSYINLFSDNSAASSRSSSGNSAAAANIYTAGEDRITDSNVLDEILERQR